MSRSATRSRWPDTVASTRCRHSKAVLWVTPHSSSAHSTGTLWRMSLLKETQAACGLRRYSRTVPASRGEPVPPGAETAAPRAPRVGPVGRGGLGERADADLIATAPLINGFSEQQELVGGQARHERPEGIRSSHIDLSHPPERPPGGIGAKQRSGWALGQILCLAGKSMAFGGLAAPESSAGI